MKQQRQQAVRQRNATRGSIRSVAVLGMSVLLGVGGAYVAIVQPFDLEPPTSETEQANVQSQAETIDIDTKGIISPQLLNVNGQLRVNNSLVLTPSVQPTDGIVGQIYFDKSANAFRYYTGDAFESLVTETGVNQAIDTKLKAQRPVIVPPTVQRLSSDVSRTTDNTFTGSNSFRDVSATKVSVIGSAVVQGSLQVSGVTSLGATTSSSLLLSTSLAVSSGGTGRNSFPTNEIVIGQGTGKLSSIANSAPGMCLVSTIGAPTFQACPSATAAGVSSLGGLTGDIVIANSSANGSTITIDNASTGTKGLASFNAGNFTVTNGAVDTVQNIASSAAPTFAGLSIFGTAAISGQATFMSGIDVQGASGITALSLDTAAAGTLSIGDAHATTINIGTTNVARTINIGTADALQTITIGSRSGGSGTLIQGGAWGVRLASGNGGIALAVNDQPAVVVDSSGGVGVTSNDFHVQDTGGNTRFQVTSDGYIRTMWNTTLDVIGNAQFKNGITLGVDGLGNGALYRTPLGFNMTTRINIPNYDVGAYNSIIAMGLDANQDPTSRVMIVADARTVAHQPTIGVLSPNENDIVGFSWDGDNGTGRLKTLSGDIGLQIGSNQVAHFSTSQISLNQAAKVTANSSGAFRVQNTAGVATLEVDTNNYITRLSGAASDASMASGTGALQIGSDSGYNIALDDNEIIARNNGAEGTLYLQNGGGGLNIGADVVHIQNAVDSMAALQVFTGSGKSVVTVDTAEGELELGSGSSLDGSLLFRNAANPYVTIVKATAPTAHRSIDLGNESGTICVQNSTTCGFVAGTPASFIQNQNSTQQSSTNFWVSGVGRADTALQAPVIDAAAGGALVLGGSNATSITIAQSTTIAASKSLLITGGATGTRPAFPSEGMVYFDTTTKQLIVYANGKWQADRSTATKIIADCSTSQNPDSADFVVPAGSTSAQTTISAAIASLPASGGSIYLKEGTYQITGTINLPSNVTLVGSGTGSIIKVPSATNTTFTMLNANTINSTNITIQNLKLDGNRSNQASGTVSGINLTNTYDSRVTNVVILNTQGTAVDLGVSSVLADSYITANGWVSGMRLVNASKDNAKITNNRLEWGGSVVYVTGSNILVSGNEINFGDQEAVNLSGTNNMISNNTIRSGTNYGIQIGGTGQVVDSNMFLTRPTLYQTVYGVGTESRFTNNFIAAGGSYVSGVNSVVSGNTFKGNADTLNSTNLVLSNNKFAGVTLTVGAQNSSIDSNVFSISGGLSVGGSNNILKGNVFNNGTSVTDTGLGTVYNNQTDSNGNIINRGTTGYTINTKTSTASLTLQGGMTNSQLPTPGAPAMQIIGSWGSAKYGYRISALDGLGETLASTESTISIGASSLSTSNYFILSWNAIPGATQYKIYRSTSTGSPSTTGLIGTVSGGVVSFNDTGLAASGTLPVANTTGGMNIAGAIQGNSGIQTPTLDTVGAMTLAVGTTNASAITMGRAGTTLSVPSSTLLTGAGNIFRNTTNSTTAFQIQDSSSTPLFVADTANAKIIISSLDVTYNLTIAGHIVGSGPTPTIAAGAAACSTPTISVAGSDTAGTVTVMTGSGCSAAGPLATLTYATPFGVKPRVSLTPASASAAGLATYVDDAASTTSSFALSTAVAPTDATTYRWYYHVLQ